MNNPPTRRQDSGDRTYELHFNQKHSGASASEKGIDTHDDRNSKWLSRQHKSAPVVWNVQVLNLAGGGRFRETALYG